MRILHVSTANILREQKVIAFDFCALCTSLTLSTRASNKFSFELHNHLHSELCSITPVAAKVHVILQIFGVLTWMRDTIELVEHMTPWNNTKCNILMVW
jgi:hypothetical protein